MVTLLIKIYGSIWKKRRVMVHTKYITEVKRICVLDVMEASNITDHFIQKYPKYPEDKGNMIKEALRYFRMIQ